MPERESLGKGREQLIERNQGIRIPPGADQAGRCLPVLVAEKSRQLLISGYRNFFASPGQGASLGGTEWLEDDSWSRGAGDRIQSPYHVRA